MDAGMIGKTVSVMTRSATGRRVYHGTLIGVADDGAVTVEIQRDATFGSVTIPAESVLGGGVIASGRASSGRR